MVIEIIKSPNIFRMCCKECNTEFVCKLEDFKLGISRRYCWRDTKADGKIDSLSVDIDLGYECFVKCIGWESRVKDIGFGTNWIEFIYVCKKCGKFKRIKNC